MNTPVHATSTSRRASQTLLSHARLDGHRLTTYKILFTMPTTEYPAYATVTSVDTDVYFAGRLIGQAAGTSFTATPTDNIGSVRQDLSLYPSPTASTFFPWGEEQTSTPNDRVKFATYRRDSESNLDYAWNRYYNNVTARFMSPDPYSPSASPSNPQSWNRYSYVLNDPIGINDPTGRDDAACDDGCSDAPYSDSGSTGGDGSSGGSSSTANYTSADVTGTHCYDPSTAAPIPCSSNSTGPMQTVGDPNSSNTVSVSAGGKGGQIASATVTSSLPGIALGGAVGGLFGPAGGAIGAVLGSLCGIGGNISFVPSTGSLYVGPVAACGLAILGGSGYQLSLTNVPPGQNPNSIASGMSATITYQPTLFTGSTATISPGSGPAVVGVSAGTRVAVSASVGYNFCVWHCTH